MFGADFVYKYIYAPSFNQRKTQTEPSKTTTTTTATTTKEQDIVIEIWFETFGHSSKIQLLLVYYFLYWLLYFQLNIIFQNDNAVGMVFTWPGYYIEWLSITKDQCYIEFAPTIYALFHVTTLVETLFWFSIFCFDVSLRFSSIRWGFACKTCYTN